VTEPGIKILVADDDAFVRDMLTDVLAAGGHNTITAENGREALEMYAAYPEAGLIISDMNMPEMNGMELIQHLREKDTDIPLIILTSNDEISIALEAIRSGANDYLLKDENIHATLLVSVDKVLEKHNLKRQNIQLLKDLAEKNQELERSNQELFKLNQQKNKFLGIAAHDLRSPISGIIGFCDLLMDPDVGDVNEEQMEYLKIIHSASSGMMTLLNDLLDVSVIESGKLELNYEIDDLKPLIEERIRILRFSAERKGIAIYTDLADVWQMPFDAGRIVQVFDNLMTNAIKFSTEGSHIHVTLIEEPDGAVVTVRDEGPGISEEEQSRLFGEFERLSARPTGGETSTGLGLAIVKKIIEAHNGVLKVDSRLGDGAAFSFKIPRYLKIP
jgi:signal transduction histidine kinase